MVVMHRVEDTRPQNLDDPITNPIPPGIRIPPSELHGRDVVLTFLRSGVERHWSRVHIVLGAGAVQKTSCDLVAKPSGAEMHADPDPLFFVFENVNVVVAAAHGPELCSGHIPQRSQLPRRAVRTLSDLPGVIVVVVEEFVVDRFLVLACKPERDRVPDVIHDARDVGAHVGRSGIGEHGLVAAADVVADA